MDLAKNESTRSHHAPRVPVSPSQQAKKINLKRRASYYQTFIGYPEGELIVFFVTITGVF